MGYGPGGKKGGSRPQRSWDSGGGSGGKGRFGGSAARSGLGLRRRLGDNRDRGGGYEDSNGGKARQKRFSAGGKGKKGPGREVSIDNIINELWELRDNAEEGGRIQRVGRMLNVFLRTQVHDYDEDHGARRDLEDALAEGLPMFGAQQRHQLVEKLTAAGFRIDLDEHFDDGYRDEHFDDGYRDEPPPPARRRSAKGGGRDAGRDGGAREGPAPARGKARLKVATRGAPRWMGSRRVIERTRDDGDEDGDRSDIPPPRVPPVRRNAGGSAGGKVRGAFGKTFLKGKFASGQMNKGKKSSKIRADDPYNERDELGHTGANTIKVDWKPPTPASDGTEACTAKSAPPKPPAVEVQGPAGRGRAAAVPAWMTAQQKPGSERGASGSPARVGPAGRGRGATQPSWMTAPSEPGIPADVGDAGSLGASSPPKPPQPPSPDKLGDFFGESLGKPPRGAGDRRRSRSGPRSASRSGRRSRSRSRGMGGAPVWRSGGASRGEPGTGEIMLYCSLHGKPRAFDRLVKDGDRDGKERTWRCRPEDPCIQYHGGPRCDSAPRRRGVASLRSNRAVRGDGVRAGPSRSPSRTAAGDADGPGSGGGRGSRGERSGRGDEGRGARSRRDSHGERGGEGAGAGRSHRDEPRRGSGRHVPPPPPPAPQGGSSAGGGANEAASRTRSSASHAAQETSRMGAASSPAPHGASSTASPRAAPKVSDIDQDEI